MDYGDLSSKIDFDRPSCRPGIKCLFVSQFDMKKGNVIVWSAQDDKGKVDLRGIEFKSLPSGVHEVSEDVINFVVNSCGDNEDSNCLYGVACYQQNGQDIAETSDQVDRSQVKMYAVGVIVEAECDLAQEDSDKLYYQWKPNQFIGCNEYIEELNQLLKGWLSKQNFEVFDDFNDYYKSNSKTLASSSIPASIGAKLESKIDSINHAHMLEFLPFWVQKLGPLIFPLWKSCLLNERILILNPPGGSFELCNSLVYCLSLLSTVPNMKSNKFIRPLFTVGINDTEFLSKMKILSETDELRNISFLASTSDEVLAYKPELYDKILRIPLNFINEDCEALPKFTTNNDTIIRATPHEFEIFENLCVILNEKMTSMQKSDFQKSTESISWLQYLIDGFYLCTTAGYIKAAYRHKSLLEINKCMAGVDLDKNNNKLAVALNVVRFFHNKTSVLFNTLKGVIDQNENENNDCIYHVPQMMLVDLDLDCFSGTDTSFVEKFTNEWFGKNLEVNHWEYLKAAC